MNVLGIIFDGNLSWKPQVDAVIKKSSWKLFVLRPIRNKFTLPQFAQILTSQFYSQFYYCSPVWLTMNTSRPLWNRTTSMHYREIRIAARNYKTVMNREKLDIICQRAPPKQWAKYAISSLVLKILRSKMPILLFKPFKKPCIL
jgi:hypothetical protein